MATDYGALKDTVAIAGSLVAAGSAIAVSWTRRAKWMPPEETVPAATSRVSGLVCAVIIGVLYPLRLRIGQVPMLGVAGMSLSIALVALIVSIWVNTAHGFAYEGKRILGGFRLTDEATAIKVKRRWNEQQLLTNANGNPDLVWTKGSTAAAQIVSTLGFIFLIAAGSIALASVAIAFSLSTGDKDTPSASPAASPGAPASSQGGQQISGNNNVQISGSNNVVNPLPTPKACRDRSHGVERYQRTFESDGRSNWMGGGFNQDAWCSQLTAQLRTANPEGQFEVVAKSEDSKSTCSPFNCPQYQYYCKVRVSTDPLYVEKLDSACK